MSYERDINDGKHEFRGCKGNKSREPMQPADTCEEMKAAVMAYGHDWICHWHGSIRLAPVGKRVAAEPASLFLAAGTSRESAAAWMMHSDHKHQKTKASH